MKLLKLGFISPVLTWWFITERINISFHFSRVTYSQHFYNLRQKLVSMKFSPRWVRIKTRNWVLRLTINAFIPEPRPARHPSSWRVSPNISCHKVTTSFTTSTPASSTRSVRGRETAGQIWGFIFREENLEILGEILESFLKHQHFTEWSLVLGKFRNSLDPSGKYFEVNF